MVKYHLPLARVTANRQTGPGLYLMTLEAPLIAQTAAPGQFLHIRVGEGAESDPFLRRPLSIYGVEREKGLVSLWYQVKGKGTMALSRIVSGSCLDVLGPLGRGFQTECGEETSILVGGGMGIAPLIFLGRELTAASRAVPPKLVAFLGARNAGQLPPLTDLSTFPYLLVTEDGSTGRQGLVTDVLGQWLRQAAKDGTRTRDPGTSSAGNTQSASLYKSDRDGLRLYACGPQPMLAELAKLARTYDLPLQVSLEGIMACGVGACLGCACQKAASPEGRWLKACQEGPVFRAEEVKWE